MPFSSLENPFREPKQRNPDDAALVGKMLGPKEEAEMKKLLSKKEAPTHRAPAQEDWGGEEDFGLSDEEKKRTEEEKIFEEIISRERQALREFFGKELLVPALPKEATRERIAEWRRFGLELHYLPPLSVAEIKREPKGRILKGKERILEVAPTEFPGWKKKPGKRYTPGQQYGIEFFDEIKAGNLDPSVLELPGGWILFDAREKPNYDDGDQMYDNDALAPALEELRKNKVIEDYKIKGSRFNLSPQELENPKVLAAFAKALNFPTVPGLTVGIPRAIEFNILGNIHHPNFDKTNTSEWFSDKYQAGSGRLCGGGSGGGGLSVVGWRGPAGWGDGVGFRVLGRFSESKQEVHKK